jgi:hypothetical protein
VELIDGKFWMVDMLGRSKDGLHLLTHELGGSGRDWVRKRLWAIEARA